MSSWLWKEEHDNVVKGAAKRRSFNSIVALIQWSGAMTILYKSSASLLGSLETRAVSTNEENSLPGEPNTQDLSLLHQKVVCESPAAKAEKWCAIAMDKDDESEGKNESVNTC